jgi:gliding motility-associated-like protein
MRGLRCLLGVVCLLWPGWAGATHIVGGGFELHALRDQPGKYRVVLNLFNDDVNARNTLGATARADVYSRATGARLLRLRLSQVSRTSLVFANEACARLRRLGFSAVRYEAVVELPAAQFSDPAGYFLTTRACCRNEVVDNIANPGRTGMQFYLEFPPVTMGNSSPVFAAPNGEYVCRGEPFAMAFGATDADGDQLRYALVTPYQNLTLSGGTRTFQPVQWQSGFDEQNQIPGSPSLRIDPTTGTLTVTASNLGLHVFSVEVEERRGGRVIGRVRRDFQLLVVDCPNLPPPTPRVFANGALAACLNGAVELKTVQNPDFNYQWQRDGVNLAGATTPILTASEPGRYTVAVSSKSGCGKTGTSAPVTVTQRAGPPAPTLTPSGNPDTCDVRPLTLAATAGDFSYLWIRDADTLRAETGPRLTVPGNGTYTVRMQDRGSGCVFFPKLKVNRNALPLPPLDKPRERLLCGTDQASIRLTASTPGYQYQWLRDGQPVAGQTDRRLRTREPGVYAVRVTGPGGCTVLSDTVGIFAGTAPTVEIDSVPPICRLDGPPIQLTARPPGGEFDGRWITDEGVFDPRRSGKGRFRITYEIEPNDSTGTCPAEARIWITVAEPPTITLPDEVTVAEGETVPLPAQVVPASRYAWEPPEDLSDPATLAPVASPAQTTVYRLRAIGPEGCFSEDIVRVVVLAARLRVPTAFSPNGDGLNDTWELFGKEAFPDLEVRVFNRWGAEIFRSKGYDRPFDGTYAGEVVPVGVYSYSISLGPGKHTYRGVLTVLR